jgi:hypothetical protein
VKTLLNAALLLTLASATARAQINAGRPNPQPSLPCTMTEVATFNRTFRSPGRRHACRALGSRPRIRDVEVGPNGRTLDARGLQPGCFV